MSTAITASEIWNSISAHASTLAETAGKAVVAVDAGHRLAASGVHWRPGVVVAAAHLVRRAEEVSVILPDGGRIKGTVAGRDSSTDLAVVKIDEHVSLATAKSGSQARVGELVLAVARSGRGELAASAGVIARVGQGWRTWRGGQIDRLIRADVRLYPGQSGSALVNGAGEFLGINSAVLARESVITLPVETVNRVLNELLERGHIARPYLGVAMQPVPVPAQWQSDSGTQQEYGLLVMHVQADGPAAEAGVVLGDVIVAAESEAVQSPRGLQRQLASKKTGEPFTVRVLRAGKPVDLTLLVGDRPQR